MKERTIHYLVEKVSRNFNSFGGGRCINHNPLSIALKDKKPQFAACVDIEEVIRFIIDEIET